VGDKKLQTIKHPLIKAFCDNMTHGLIGLFSAAIVLVDNIDKLYFAGFCMMVDIDHFLVARSLKLSVRNKTNFHMIIF
jgi:hypothetical protein